MTSVSIPSMTTDPATFRLLNDWQHQFPLVSRPFAQLGEAVGLPESSVIERYRALIVDGLVSRIGPVFAPRRLGASALVAMSVPPARLEAVAALVSSEPTINHNYQREHHFNLWFVVTAASSAQLDEVIKRVELGAGCMPVVLPLEREFHIDLGFDLGGKRRRRMCASAHGIVGCADEEDVCQTLTPQERDLVVALQSGVALVPAPFAVLGARTRLGEEAALAAIEGWIASGLIRRFGVVVRHHELGFDANAMCVWDIPDEKVPELGRRLAAEPAVSLCYSRRRARPQWPYNLFCMIHGRERDAVLDARRDIAMRLGLDVSPHAVLFSCRRFKQTGAQYLAAQGSVHA